MEVPSPIVVVLAGPNGAGKTSSSPSILREALGVEEFVNADIIARGLSVFEPERVAISAGRIMLARLRQLASQRHRFAFETTLASRSFAPWIGELISTGYQFHLVFLWLPDAEMAVARVAARVSEGGHSVPEETIRRRYHAGLRNFFTLYRSMATTWEFWDNTSEDGLRLIAAGSGDAVSRVEDTTTWDRVVAVYANGGQNT